MTVRADPRFAGPRPVRCRSCAAVVEVVKFSPAHTSVQWSLDAMRACLEFADVAAAGGETALSPGCARLRASIEDAVRSGSLPVWPPVPEAGA